MGLPRTAIAEQQPNLRLFHAFLLSAVDVLSKVFPKNSLYSLSFNDRKGILDVVSNYVMGLSLAQVHTILGNNYSLLLWCMRNIITIVRESHIKRTLQKEKPFPEANSKKKEER